MKIYTLTIILALFLGLMVGAHLAADMASADPIPGQRVQVPVIWTTGGWETEIQVQNVGATTTRAVLLLWGPYSGECEPNDPGPIIAQCSGNIRPGSAQAWMLREVWPDDPMSGIIYSVDTEKADEACEAARDALGDSFDWREWEKEWDNGTGLDLTFGDPDGARGESVAVTVTRFQLGGGSEIPRVSSYDGITEEMEGIPDNGTYTYFVPLNFDTYNPSRWQTIIYIQNSGDTCTGVDITFQQQEACTERYWEEIASLAPGETVAILSTLGGDEVGSAWIRSSEPLGVIVDEENADGDALMSYHGLPRDMGSIINHAPVIYKDFEGWNSGVQVQNLSGTHRAKVKVYFLDNGGGIITSIVDWICPWGSRTYFLPVIAHLPEHYVGAVRVESQAYLSPGAPSVEAPEVFSVVNLVNYLTRQALSYNTFPEPEVQDVGAVALPTLVKEVSPFVNGITWSSEILIQNLNPSYLGDVTVRIDFFDANGLVESVCQTIGPNSVDLVDMERVGILPPAWSGSGVVTWQCGGLWGIDVLVVERASGNPFSDLSKGYQGVPLLAGFTPPVDLQCPGCPET